MTEAHIWLKAWRAAVASGKAASSDAAKEWADACVAAYRLRYRATRTPLPEPPAKTGKPRKR